MVRFVILVAILILSISLSAAPPIEEECMDCYEKATITEVQNGWDRHDFEAECCDAPCEYPEGWELKEENVGWGCRVSQLPASYGTSLNWYGTVCNSSEDDQDCPPPGPIVPDDPPTCPYPPCNPSPIILDLGGDSYQLTPLARGVEFDLRNEGRRRRVSWTRPGIENAFLALDRNGNGQIDNGSELFGNFTPLRSGGLAAHGFIALAELDDNGDHVVDRRDVAWSRLLLWTDRNHDGVSTNNELEGIAGSVVAELGTEFRQIRKKDQWGNEFLYMSRFRMRNDERRRAYYDVFLLMEP